MRSQIKSNQDFQYVVILVICSVTLAYLLSVILLIVIKKLHKSLLIELILYLLVSSLVNTISIMLYHVKDTSAPVNQRLCNLQAFLMITFELSQNIWASIVSHSIYKNVVQYDREDIEANESFYHRLAYILLGFFLPLGISIPSFLVGDLGPSINYCWFNTELEFSRVKIPMAVYYAFLWLLICFNSVMTWRIIRFIDLRFNFNSEEKRIVRNYIKGLLRYPVVPLIVLLPATLKRLGDLVGFDSEAIHWVFMILVSLQGLVYGVTFGWNNEISCAFRDCWDLVFKRNRVSPSEHVISLQRDYDLQERSYNECKEDFDTFVNSSYYDDKLMRDKA